MKSPLLERLAALSNPSRMAVFRLLVRRFPHALPAGEVAGLLGFKPSTTSVYLSSLSKSGLIRQERQGTSLFYTLNPEAARDVISEFFVDCCRSRPDLVPTTLSAYSGGSSLTFGSTLNVLFVCTSNTTRSILAEAIARDAAGDLLNAYSAGTRPGMTPDPFTIETLQLHGIDTRHLSSKPIADFERDNTPPFNFIFTLCDQAVNEDFLIGAGQPIRAHWGLPDPARMTGTYTERSHAFDTSFKFLTARIEAFLALVLSRLDPGTVQSRVDEIGKMTTTS